MVLKKQKNPENSHNRDNNDVGVGEDKISNLPDELTHHILSFLPTKCAMSTCILSKRWMYVVNTIPILDFRHWRTRTTRKEKKLETKWFMNFLDTILFLREKPNIQKFYLDFDKFFDESRVNGWISTIMKRKVEEFCLRIKSTSTPFRFPLSFFTCDSLTLLDFDFDTGDGFYFLPNAVYFPKLKILRLKWVSFVDETSTRRLFSNCPVLEELRLFGCKISEGLCIVHPVLKHLFITYCLFSNAMTTVNTTTVKISAPNLLTISYTRNPPADFVLDSFPSLVEADIGIYLHFGTFVLTQFLEKLSNVKHLKMSGSCFQVSSKADIHLTDAFKNLIHLEVSSTFYSTRFGSDSVSTAVRRFFRFLQLAPFLQSIVFAESIYIPEEEDHGCWSLDPRYSLPHLKSIEIKSFMGTQMELNGIKLFLKYADFLETVTIVPSLDLSKDQEKQLNVAKLLLKFPKPANCVVDVL